MPMRRNELLYNIFKYQDMHLQHYGTPGQKWGVRHWQNQDGTFNAEGKLRYFGTPKKKNPKGTVFISGSSKTQFDDSPYYKRELPKPIQNKINQYMKQGKTILVGDAPGIDRQVQDYLNDHDYKDVEVYSPGTEVRYNANPEWKTNTVNVPNAEMNSGEWLAGKDKAMSERADEGLAIVLDNGSKATRNNIERLEDQNKNCDVYQLNEDGSENWSKLGPFDAETLKSIKKQGYDLYSYENDGDEADYLNNVSNYMSEDFDYDNSDHKLQTSSDTFKKKSGNCHDQTLFEKELFEQMGLQPKAVFLMEVDPETGQGGTTHSFVYFQNPNGKNVVKFENAWRDEAGTESFSSVDRMKDYIEWKHKTKNNFGNSEVYPEIVWGEFKGEPGDDLQDIVTKSLSNEKIGADSFIKDVGLTKRILQSFKSTTTKAKKELKEIHKKYGKKKFLSK